MELRHSNVICGYNCLAVDILTARLNVYPGHISEWNGTLGSLLAESVACFCLAAVLEMDLREDVTQGLELVDAWSSQWSWQKRAHSLLTVITSRGVHVHIVTMLLVAEPVWFVTELNLDWEKEKSGDMKVLWKMKFYWDRISSFRRPILNGFLKFFLKIYQF